MKKYKNIIPFIIISVSLVLLLILLFFNPFVYFKLEGKKEFDISVNSEYSLPNIKAFIFNNNISEKITIKNNLNINKVGKYEVIYKVKYFLTTKKIKLIINVVDKELPNIILNGEDNLIICPNIDYIEEGYVAFDNYDGDITNKVEIIDDETGKLYIVKDSSNNPFSIKRNIIKEDKESPSIILNGNSKYKIAKGSKYIEKGYSATDNCDGDISNSVEIINDLNVNKIGTYTITYNIKDSSGNENSITRIVEVVDNTKSNDYINIVEGPTYINGILIVNKKYSIPKNFGGTNSEATNALHALQDAATLAGFNIPLVSGYRSYNRQNTIYNNYVKNYGQESADTFSARPGHSEHQTGFAFDVGKLDDNYGNTPAGIWLKENAHYYGFIIRYPKGKEHITGYKYEPWHIRYLGVQIATDIYNKGVTLEEYLGV